MIIDGYVAEQIKTAMLNSEQEQVKVYDAYYNKGVTDGYNKALEDFSKTLKDDWSYKISEISDRIIDRIQKTLMK